jgi:hypothetical protein
MIKIIPDEIHARIVEAEHALENGLITLEQKWDAVRVAITAETENKMLAPIGENG